MRRFPKQPRKNLRAGFAAMQTRKGKAAARALFEATTEELGQAAVRGAQANCSGNPNSCPTPDHVVEVHDMAQEAERPASHPTIKESLKVGTLQLGPEDQVAIAESLLNPPPIAEAMHRAIKRRKKLLGQAENLDPLTLAEIDEEIREVRRAMAQRVMQVTESTESNLAPVLQNLANKETMALRQILALGQREVEAGQVEYISKALQRIKIGPPPAEDGLKEGVRDHMRQKHFRPRAVRVIADVEAFLYGGGWAMGWDILRAGTEFYLTELKDGQVQFLLGARPPVAGDPREGGFVYQEDLGSFEDLP